MIRPLDSRIELFGNRHLKQDAGERLLPVKTEAKKRRVRITASPHAANTVAGQHTLWLLANLLARQFGIIHELEVLLPSVSVAPGVAHFGAGGDLAETIANTASLVAHDAMAVFQAKIPGEAIIEVSVGGGGTPLAPVEHYVSVSGYGWNVWAGEAAYRHSYPSFQDNNPIGPYFAACIGAGEVFKHLRGMREGKGTFIKSHHFSLWDIEKDVSAESKTVTFSPIGLELPSFYLIGAGAVGQALAATLSASRVRGHATIIDHDIIDASNLNRYPLSVYSDINCPKSDFVANILQNTGMTSLPYNGRWPNYAYENPHAQQINNLQRLEAEYKYELILSCVDKNSTRHAIQSFWPRYIIGGSTDDLSLQIFAYDMRSPYECLKCGNPIEVGGKSIEEVADEISQLSAEQRRMMIIARGGNPENVEAFLKDPKCGELGEQELQKFLNKHNQPDWSVGFVSVASGIMLASKLIKYAIGGPELAFPTQNGNASRYNFLNPGFRNSFHQRREKCDCSTQGYRDYASLWGD